MKKTTIGLLAAGVIAGTTAYSSAYTVDETQQAVITRFGKIEGTVSEPGLHFKLPFVDTVNYFSKQLLPFLAKPKEIITQDKKYIEADTVARWRISDPALYMQKLVTENGAQAKMDNIIMSEVKSSVSRLPLLETVRTTNRKIESTEEIKVDKIFYGRAKQMADITKRSNDQLKQYGIEIVDVRLKRADLADEVKASVYERMKADRNKIASRYISEGNSEAARIHGTREFEKKKIIADAQRQDKEIRGKADAIALETLAKAHKKGAEFYSFQRSLKALEDSTHKGTHYVLSTKDNEILKRIGNSK